MFRRSIANVIGMIYLELMSPIIEEYPDLDPDKNNNMCKLGKKSYGSGYLAGMKLGDMPLVEYTRDRLHREVLRRFGPTLSRKVMN